MLNHKTKQACFAINNVKSTLDGTNSRITEAEDRISEVEDRMVEINEAERKKEKRMKRNQDNFREFWSLELIQMYSF